MDTVKTRIQAEDKTAKNQEREKQQRQQQQGGLFRRSFTGSTMISLQQQQQQQQVLANKPFLYLFYESVKSEGLLELFAGLEPKMFHAFLSSFAYFLTFSGLKRKVERDSGGKKISVTMSLVISTIAAATNVILTEPLDTLSTRAQVRKRKMLNDGKEEGGELFRNRSSKNYHQRSVDTGKKHHASDDDSESGSESDDSESDGSDNESIISTPEERRRDSSKTTMMMMISSKAIEKLHLMKFPSKKILEKKKKLYRKRVLREYNKAKDFLTITLPDLYCGVSASLLLTINPTIQYTMYEQLRQRALKGLSVGQKRPVTELPVFEAIVIAALSKAAATIATYPLIRAKVLQKAATSPPDSKKDHNKNSDKQISNSFFALLEIMVDLKKREGISGGLYKGLNAQMTKTVVASAIGLSIKEKSFRVASLLVAAFSRH